MFLWIYPNFSLLNLLFTQSHHAENQHTVKRLIQGLNNTYRVRAESKLCDQSHYRNYYFTFPIRLPSAMSCVSCCYYVCFENFGLNSEAINALRCVPYVVFELKYRVKAELYLPAAAQSVPMLCIHWIERLNAPIRNQKKKNNNIVVRNKEQTMRPFKQRH